MPPCLHVHSRDSDLSELGSRRMSKARAQAAFFAKENEGEVIGPDTVVPWMTTDTLSPLPRFSDFLVSKGPLGHCSANENSLAYRISSPLHPDIATQVVSSGPG